MEDRQSFIRTQGEKLTPIEGINHNAAVAVPIISSGDVLGAVVFLSAEGIQPSQTDLKLAQVASSFLGRQMEE